jgi:hypothetical protein
MFSKKNYNLTDEFREIRKKVEKSLLLSIYKKNDFTFDFYVNEDMAVEDFLKILISRKPHFWDIIKKAIASSPRVSIVYSDRYLNTPLGCILLSQLIRQIRASFHVSFESIVIKISRTGFHHNRNNPSSTMIFSNYTQRDRFLQSCMKLLVDADYIEKERNVPHQRVLTISNEKCSLDIVFDGGIAYGWRLSHKDDNLTLEQMETNITYNYDCINQLSRKYDRKGIFFVVRMLFKD